jgi:uncharacterized membrane protein
VKQVRGETDLLHRTFIISIAGKGLFGLFETLSAFLAWFISPTQVQAFTHWIIEVFFNSNAQNPIAKLVLEFGSSIDTSTTHYAAMYLAFHGLTKVVLVWALFTDKKWAYPGMLGALSLFIVTQTIQLLTAYTLGLLLLTMFDIFVLWLTLREYKLHRSSRGARATKSSG